ncbi:MAG: delta-lactam-biosynthetic de-N-acetylase [Christensenellales bacterium]
MSEWLRSRFYYILLSILSLGILCHCVFLIDDVATSAVPIKDWGVSYQKDGKQPIGNASKEFLAQYNSFFVGGSEEKVIYLTFDAGYENGYTAKILDTLKENDVPAAFFLVSHYIKTNPALVNRMVEEGHLVCNHTATHPDMSKISSLAEFQKELEDNESVFKQATAHDMAKYYRPPAGKVSETNLAQAKELGYYTIFWSLAYVDWYQDNQPSPQTALSTVLPRIHNGAVILLHSTSKTNAEILGDLITEWKNAGYRFMSLDDLVASAR